jgi:hypothetical protein
MRGNLKLRFGLNIQDERHFQRRHQARNIMTARALPIQRLSSRIAYAELLARTGGGLEWRV